CLMEKHEVETAGDAADVAQRLHIVTHKKRCNCACSVCHHDRLQGGCNNPHKCMLAVEKVLDCLTEKWNPRRPDQDDGLALTPEDKTRNEEARETNGRIRFNPDIDSESLLTDRVRVFTSGWDTCSRPAMRETCTITDDVPEVAISIAYTDSSAYNNGTVDAQAGAGVWFGDDDARNIF
ncbi:hypothetical protein ARMGADRAFT_942283, partial [Armillaria gallica]